MPEFNQTSENLFNHTLQAYLNIQQTNLIRKSELIEASDLIQSPIDQLYISSEANQITGAYKIRGAYNKIDGLSEKQKRLGIITASAGNHSQAVALLAKEMDIPLTIVMPESTPDFKLDRVKMYADEDATIILEGSNFDEAEEYAHLIAIQDYLTMIHPFDDFDIMAGQGTWAVEIAKQVHNLDTIYIPFGGGGLLGGVANFIKNINPSIRIVAVEPEGAASLTLALKEGKPSTLDTIDTFIDGASVKKIGELVFDLITENNLVDDVTTVTNEEVKEALIRLRNRKSPINSELAGALSYAAYLKDVKKSLGERVLCLVTGGNISEKRYSEEVAI
mgnify:CR=1 FL=1